MRTTMKNLKEKNLSEWKNSRSLLCGNGRSMKKRTMRSVAAGVKYALQAEALEDNTEGSGRNEQQIFPKAP